jgi:hypothetical protein
MRFQDLLAFRYIALLIFLLIMNYIYQFVYVFWMSIKNIS